MSSTPIQPRMLTDRETSVATKLLSSGATGASEYLAQVPYSQVVATWGVGSPSVDLAVRPGAVQASGVRSRSGGNGGGGFSGDAATDST
ncbi:hypothetical protein [Nocardia nepalensis]|uniref:hypothetical protein n=1 Tax=Nocardia nepalensis TaxID=3375448 RepID=UPI003B67E2BF